MDTALTCEKYFAAANTYAGFKSYFHLIFAPKNYDRIYVLKGGPGTGKSSFMKRFAADLLQKGCKTEEIYCSSDPRSLDGIIAYNGDKKIAIIDGTAPHETDAKLPGAFDEIINLGDAWDTRWLLGERERILQTNVQKSDAYKSAYASLSIAGAAQRIKTSFMQECYDAKSAKTKIKSSADLFGSDNSGLTKTRLVSAFGKHGLFKLSTYETMCNKVFSLHGNDYACLRFMTDLYREFEYRGIEMTASPFPLDQNAIEAIYIPKDSVCFIIGGGGEQIGVDDYFRNDELINERLKCAEECHKLALNDAKRWFSVASELHFTLEDIYTQAMNFDAVDAIYKKKFAEACDILNL